MLQTTVASSSLTSQLFLNVKEYINDFFATFDVHSMDRLIAQIVATQGMVLLTGVGKSGSIAKKIASTLNSSGTRALFLQPTDALHGDIGIVQRNDIVLLLSKSGESDELLHLCPVLRNKGAFLVAVISNENSHLARAADLVIYLPVTHELCPFNMVPTTSTIIQLIFGELLAAAVMREKKFTVNEYAKNHPAGRIGKRLTLFVRDICFSEKDIPLARPTDLLIASLSELSDKRCGCLLIVNEAQELLGIFTDGDLRRTLEKHAGNGLSKPLGELMTRTPVVTSPHILAYDALKLMEANPQKLITVLPVLEGQKVVGILRLHDIIQAGIA